MCYITSISAEERQTFSVCVLRAWPWTSVITASSGKNVSLCKGLAHSDPLFFFFINLNVNRAQRAPALACLSPHCLLNHWATIGLWVHEEVLSAGTLEKAFKKTFNQVWLQRIHLQECKYTSASVQGASVSPRSKSSCQRKAYGSQIWFQRSFCYCINPLFVLNLTYPHSCSYPPPTPLFGERAETHLENQPDPSRARTLGWSRWWGWPFRPTWKDVMSSSVTGGRMSARSPWSVCGVADWGTHFAVTRIPQTRDLCAFKHETGSLSPKWLM